MCRRPTSAWPAKSPRRLRAVFASRIATDEESALPPGGADALRRRHSSRHRRSTRGSRLLGALPDAGAAAALRRSPSDTAGEAAHRDLQRRLSTYDVMILPTLGENFGHIIVEAWAAGCPVLISDRTPWRQLTSQGLGWDVPLDHEAWIRAIRRMPGYERRRSPDDATAGSRAGAACLAAGRRWRRIAAVVDRSGRASTGVRSRRRGRAGNDRRQRHRHVHVGIVAPDLREPGGVREKALFVARALIGQLGASVQIVSLATSRIDASSVLLRQPRTWRRSLVSSYTVEEFTVDHVGAVGAEIEVARYARRRVILKLLERCDVLHVVVRDAGLGPCRRWIRGPVVVHFASFVRHERCRADAGPAVGPRWVAALDDVVGGTGRARCAPPRRRHHPSERDPTASRSARW